MGIKINATTVKAVSYKKGEILTNRNGVVLLVVEDKGDGFDALVLNHVNYPTYYIIRNVAKDTLTPWEVFAGEVVLTNV